MVCPRPNETYPALWAALVLSVGAFCGCNAQKAESDKVESSLQQPADDATQLVARVAPTAGYVDDGACQPCHQDLFASYQSMGMARSFYPATPEDVVEDFEDNHYYHAPSRQHFEMLLKEDGIYQRRYVLNQRGEKEDLLEIKADAIIGSGNHVRCYVYRTPSGEMFQMPLAWYTESRQWRMNPGYDRPDHVGFSRKINRECMFCHNAYPTGTEFGSDEHWYPNVFPDVLPHGIGCQRCHGPGASQV